MSYPPLPSPLMCFVPYETHQTGIARGTLWMVTQLMHSRDGGAEMFALTSASNILQGQIHRFPAESADIGTLQIL